MKHKKWLIPAAVAVVIAALAAALGGIAARRSWSVSEGRFLEGKNGHAMLIVGNEPICMSDRTGRDLFDDLDTGDRILVLHDGVAESYPAQTGAYAVFRLEEGSPRDIPQRVIDDLTDMGWLEAVPTVGVIPRGAIAAEELETAVAYANWTDSEEFYFAALNREKMVFSNIPHLPVYKFDTLSELEQFKAAFDGVLAMDYGYDEVPSFEDVTGGCDEDFFAEHTLVLVYVSANSGTYRFAVSGVYCDGEAFCVHVVQTNHPEVVTDDMAGWFVTVAVPDSMVETCTAFDADLNAPKE